MEILERKTTCGTIVYCAASALKEYNYLHLNSNGFLIVDLKKAITVKPSITHLTKVNMEKADPDAKGFIDEFAKRYPNEYNKFINMVEIPMIEQLI